MELDILLKEQLKQSGYMGEFDLASLIEACGEEIVGLTKYVDGRFLGHGWAAIYHKTFDSRPTYIEEETPEEAVAKLWLALNHPLT
jgi:hypothetical protein